MKLHHLSTFQLEVLSLADSGVIASVLEIVQGLHTQDPLGWLQRRFPDGRLGRWSFGHDAKVAEELNDALTRHANVLGSNDTGVSHNGVLFLAAVINNIMASEGEWTRA